MSKVTSSGLVESVSKLSLKISKSATVSQRKKAEPVADSWEDEDLSSGVDTDTEEGAKTEATDEDDGTHAPPPTPLSPTLRTQATQASLPSDTPYFAMYTGVESPDASSVNATSTKHTSATSGKRPETTDATVRRFLAHDLGLRELRGTKEQCAYDRAVKERERKRQQEEREKRKRQVEDAARASQAVWDD